MVRLKHRYIICQALEQPVLSVAAANHNHNHNHSGEPDRDAIAAKDVSKVIKEKVELLYGEVGAGSYGNAALVKAFDVHARIFVVRTAREAEDQLRLALASVNTVKVPHIHPHATAYAAALPTDTFMCSHTLPGPAVHVAHLGGGREHPHLHGQVARPLHHRRQRPGTHHHPLGPRHEPDVFSTICFQAPSLDDAGRAARTAHYTALLANLEL